MANTNFVVHNGLTVGPLTIDAVTGDIVTTGNISGAFIGIASDQIRNGASNIRVTTDWVNVSVKGSNVLSVGSLFTSLNAGYLNVGGNVLAVTGSFGAVNSTGLINTSGNVLATAGVFNALTVNGNETVTGFLNVTGNVITDVCEAATVETTGMVRANSTVAASSATTGAIVTAGGIGVLKDSVFGGNVTIDGNLFVNGNTSVFNTNNLSINDSMIYLADDNSADVLDIGIVSAFTNPGYQHTGFVRDATDGIWKLFANVVAEPTTTVDFTNATYSTLRLGVLQVNPASAATAIVNSGTSGVGNIGATGATFNTVFAKATTAQYADLAEKYLADAEYSPGTVVHFGGEQEVSLCDVDMCKRVAGVVSTQPGYIMNEGLSGEHVVVVALTGRVPTKVRGPVHKGDLMVSAGDGHARAENLPQVGTVIGKALENFNGDTGVIEVVVGKH